MSELQDEANRRWLARTQLMRQRLQSHKQLLEACESAYTHLAVAWQFHENMRTTTDLRVMDQLEQAIRAAGGKVIGANGKEVK